MEIGIIRNAQKRAFSKKHITKNFVCAKLDITHNFIIIIVQKPLLAIVLREIAVDAYLKLGVNRINYSIENQNSYNLFIQPYNNSMISTEERIATSPSVVSIDELAQKTEMSRQQVEGLIEQGEIPLIMKEGELVLTRNAAQALISRLYNQKRDAVISSIFADEEGTLYELEDVTEETTNHQEIQSSSQLNSPPRGNEAFDSSMELPANFDIMANRKRRPDVVTGLKIAIAALRTGDSKEGYANYLKEIVTKTAASKQFLEIVGVQFVSPTRKIEAAIAELKDAAAALWNKIDN